MFYHFAVVNTVYIIVVDNVLGENGQLVCAHA